MNTTNINIKTDPKTKYEAEKVFDALGLSMSNAINIFLKQTVREQGFPFELMLNVPNKVTQSAIEKGKRIAEDPNGKGYNNIDDLLKALDLWNVKFVLQNNLRMT